MSAHVLLNLLNKLGKRDKMRGLLSILSPFHNEFNKFNNTRARMFDSIYHMTKIPLKSHFCCKKVTISSLCIAPDKAAYCVFTQLRGPENAIKLISVRTKTQ